MQSHLLVPEKCVCATEHWTSHNTVSPCACKNKGTQFSRVPPAAQLTLSGSAGPCVDNAHLHLWRKTSAIALALPIMCLCSCRMLDRAWKPVLCGLCALCTSWLCSHRGRARQWSNVTLGAGTNFHNTETFYSSTSLRERKNIQIFVLLCKLES